MSWKMKSFGNLCIKLHSCSPGMSQVMISNMLKEFHNTTWHLQGLSQGIRSYGLRVLRRCLGRCRRPLNEFPKGTRWLTVPSVPWEAANWLVDLSSPLASKSHEELDVSELTWCIYEVKCVTRSKVVCYYEHFDLFISFFNNPLNRVGLVFLIQ